MRFLAPLPIEPEDLVRPNWRDRSCSTAQSRNEPQNDARRSATPSVHRWPSPSVGLPAKPGLGKTWTEPSVAWSSYAQAPAVSNFLLKIVSVSRSGRCHCEHSSIKPHSVSREIGSDSRLSDKANAVTTPEWQDLPAWTRRKITGLMARLLVEHSLEQRTGHGEDSPAPAGESRDV